MATTTELTEQLALKQSEYDKLTSEISQLTIAAQDWYNQANAGCSGLIGKKKDACIADKAYKKSRGDAYTAQIADKKNLQKNLISDMNSIRSAMAAKEEQGKILAQQGISATAEETKASGQAAAALKSAEITATAQAKALETQTTTDAQKERNKQIITYSVIAIVFIVFAIILFKKLKKNKKK